MWSSVCLPYIANSLYDHTARPTSRTPNQHERLDRPTLVHGGVGFLDTVEIRLEIENKSRINAGLQDILKQLWDVLEVGCIKARGVVDEHVDAPEALDGGLHCCLGILGAGDVQL